MIGRAAAGDRDLRHRAQHDLFDLQFRAELDVARLVDAPAERFLDDVRLLEDLLEHEVLEAALLGRRSLPGDLPHFALDRFAVERGERVAVAAHFDDLALLEHDHLARVLQHRRDVGGDEHLALTQTRRPAARRRCARRSGGRAHPRRSRPARTRPGPRPACGGRPSTRSPR